MAGDLVCQRLQGCREVAFLADDFADGVDLPRDLIDLGFTVAVSARTMADSRGGTYYWFVTSTFARLGLGRGTAV